MNDLSMIQLHFELTRSKGFPLIVTGAGISLASGIPTFRGSDPDAVWSKDVLEKGTFAYFQADPVGSWLWYLARFDAARNAKPNPAHYALAELERKAEADGRRFMLLTQNVDGLHLDAGSKNVVEIHGAARKMRCASTFARCQFGAPDGFMPWNEAAFTAFRANPCHETLPRCPDCGTLLRAHVLWFDEGYTDHEDYGLDRLFAHVEEFTSVIYIGTSFAVSITDIIMTTAFESDIPQFIIDPHAKPIPDIPDFKVAAEDFLPAFVANL